MTRRLIFFPFLVIVALLINFVVARSSGAVASEAQTAQSVDSVETADFTATAFDDSGAFPVARTTSFGRCSLSVNQSRPLRKSCFTFQSGPREWSINEGQVSADHG